jgi:hypothetical protein
MSAQVILERVRATTRLTEGELRYQLAKRGHPLADSDGLIHELRRMERLGLVRCELLIAVGERA